MGKRHKSQANLKPKKTLVKKKKSKYKLNQAVSHLKDLKKNCYSQKEHTLRVMNRENTPWCETACFYPAFENKKDAFIEKYQVLLDYQEMLEKRISGKIYKHQEKPYAASKTLSIQDKEATIKSIEPSSHIEHKGSSINLRSIQEAEPSSLNTAEGENYFQRINRENKEYQETLKHYFDSYFKNMKEDETEKYGLFKTSKLKKL